MMRKLLQISIEINSGSTGRIAEQIGLLAISKGWESYITYARGFNPSQSIPIKVGNRLNIYNHVIQTRFFGNHLKSSSYATNGLIRKIKMIAPDIIQLHQLHGYYLNLNVLFNFLKAENIPVIWTMHDCWAFTGHCAYFTLANCDKWKTECGNCPQIYKYPKSFIDKSNQDYHLKKKLFNSVPKMTIVAVSDWLNNLVKNSFFKNQEIVTIQNGVDVSKFYPRKNVQRLRTKYDIPEGPVIMGVGTIWTKSKGLFDYFKLRKILPETINIVLVGLTKNQIKKLPNGIVGIRRTESINELAELYSLADIVTGLSYQEAFGLTPIEGFACGTPAIVYNTTALPELVSSEVGRIVEPGNVFEVRRAILEILNIGTENFKQYCINKAQIEFNDSLKFESYMSLYEQKLSDKHELSNSMNEIKPI